jgi:flagellar biosynthesis chaperone FliJ
MGTVIEEITLLEKQIDKARKNLFTLQGQRTEILNRLKELGIETVEEAKVELENLSGEIDSLETKINTQLAELKEQFQW